MNFRKHLMRVDRQTNEVAIAMALSNLNLRILSIVHLTINFNLAGGVTPSSDVLVLNLEPSRRT
ncbi:uncharacterized protein PHALS_15410 [Plasmopara halstedii]|uniref:Uncharacterized protein n=1 Tax=Plasmopara halstedii TaxID=4781 RepID=A0A0P1ATN0_PLAHL|nr:uncharacterized protein PHALS_15410 [Plasmopara halstedii]CEG44661.1 hypothetical protein PHALS_15410 [Plasmopara halstedii]|eukprot:XP_024581030.1 hypothetical protein PHALS_15410 [Plasmopara halstedii]